VQQYLRLLAAAVVEARWLTRERLLLCGSCLAFVTIGVIGLDVATNPIIRPIIVGNHLGIDFIQFWESARLAADGKPAAAYALGAPFHTTELAIAYPPLIMLLSWPLAGLSYPYALGIWIGLGVLLFSWTLSRVIGWEMAIFASIGTPAALFNIFLGQNGFYTAIVLAGGLMLVERRPVPAGILLGMLSCKPQLGLLLLPALVAGGHWRVVVAAAATVFLLILVTLVLFGHETWFAFFARLPAQRDLMENRTAAWPWMPSMYAMLRLIGASSPVAYMVQALSTIGAVVAVVRLWRGPAPLAVKSAGLVIAALLATPYVWAYDTVVLTFAAAWLARDGSRSGFLPWEKITVLMLLTLLIPSVTASKLVNLQIGPVLLWLALAVVIRRGSQLASLSRVRVGTSAAQSAA
jgi:Glycosyltransferase family 87